jgi:hypothetical protein
MSFDSAASPRAAAPLPLQYVSIELMPVLGGRYTVAMEATLLDESELQFVAEELVHEHVDNLDQALALIQRNVAAALAIDAQR